MALVAHWLSSRGYVNELSSVSLASSHHTLCSTVQLCAAVPCHSVDITGRKVFSTVVQYGSQLHLLPVLLLPPYVGIFLVLVTCKYL